MSFIQRALVGATAALFPDIDYLLFSLNPLEFLAYWHRAWTHSIVLAPLWALLLWSGWQLSKHMKKHGTVLYWISLAALLSHIALDSLTMFGTQWLTPFSDYKISMNLLFVIDGYFTLGAILVLSVLFFKQTSKSRWLVVFVPIAYLSLVYQLKHQAYQHLAMDGGEISADLPIDLMPQPFSPYYWQVIEKNQNNLNQAYLRLADDPIASIVSTLLGYPSQQDYYHQLPGRLQWRHFSLFPEQSSLREQARDVWNHQSFSAFQDFAAYPVFYQYDDKNQNICVWFSDLRYYWPNALPSFRYGMCKNNIQDWTLYRKKYFSDQAVQITLGSEAT